MEQLGKLDKLRYHSQHLSFLINATVMQEAARVMTRTPRPSGITPAVLREIGARRDALHRRDLENVDAGMYPRELLFDIPVWRYLREIPKLMRDVPRVLRRKRAGDYKDIPAVDPKRYPAYYRRTFHWQSGGYFSEQSAEVYELGVELLFRGTADVMRRQVIPPITRLQRARGGEPLRVLDVACGTGRTLHQLARAHPQMRLYGVDLSPAYVRRARERLRDVGELTLAVDNAERLPWADATFDAVTSVYLFHELPRNARRNAMRELARVCKPGGVVVVEDSAQPTDSPALAGVLRDFPREFHEPFYDDYLEDDLGSLMSECGLGVESCEAHLVAKVVTARR
jgi:ubiquinone/menaquinone biosynthesis C-methylase UbiE|nr:class I SAM-dependent methyltransferase [Kofleriaceae bacterium]